MRSLRCPSSTLSTEAPDIDPTGVDPEVGQLPDERVSQNLEDQRRERLVIRGLTRRRRLARRIDAVHRRNVEWRGKVVDDGIQQRLNTLVLERAATQDGLQPVRDRPSPRRRR